MPSIEYLSSADWVWQAFTIAAALFQVARNTSQRTLSDRISAIGATYVRFLFGLPVAILWLALLFPVFGWHMANPGAFLMWCLIGGVVQILGNGCLLLAMRERSFMLAVAYSKTEAIQAALLAIVLLGEAIRMGVGVALIIATAGVMMITLGRGTLREVGLAGALKSRGALWGLLCGALFGYGATLYRAAALASEATPFIAAAYTLITVLLIQSVILTIYLVVRAPQTFAGIRSSVRLCLFSGAMGGLASLCWFTAMALHTIADVRALGLTEMLFSYLASRRLYREGITRAELAGSVLIGGAALALIYVN
ncbi:DMT family transporter [Szabonella alba]|uniref:DMT family transporter n=1 Tax=Szabonella alba TaxID=2804194 RepID=A0A8K0Y1T2_9RHOB|nr:DMT family transporter [Szabonella alba]MBL4919231.1 DMT family transporter [Szabonella alba]